RRRGPKSAGRLPRTPRAADRLAARALAILVGRRGRRARPDPSAATARRPGSRPAPSRAVSGGRKTAAVAPTSLVLRERIYAKRRLSLATQCLATRSPRGSPGAASPDVRGRPDRPLGTPPLPRSGLG